MIGKLKYKVVYALATFIYNCIASKMPSSYNAKTRIPQRLRAWCAQYLLAYCGKDVNIEKNVEIRWSGIELGDRSSFGEGSIIGGNTIVGKNVMIGRQLITIPRNHRQ